MKLEINMMRTLYLVNIYQPITRDELSRVFLGGTRTLKDLNNAIRHLREGLYIRDEEPFACRPRGLAALQSVKLYKSRDASRLFHLMSIAKSDSVSVDER